MIKYYLKQDPILPNVETYRPLVPAQRDHVLKNLDKLVIQFNKIEAIPGPQQIDNAVSHGSSPRTNLKHTHWCFRVPRCQITRHGSGQKPAAWGHSARCFKLLPELSEECKIILNGFLHEFSEGP
jgi:hypothetical protein